MAQNPIVLFAKLRKPQFHKLRIFILRFFLWMNQLEFGQNEHRKDAPHFSFGSRRIFLVHFDPNMKNCGNLESSFDWPIFKKQNLQYNNFRNFRNCDLLANQFVFYSDCDRHSKSWIVLFAKSCFFAIAMSQLSQSILQSWLNHYRDRDE